MSLTTLTPPSITWRLWLFMTGRVTETRGTWPARNTGWTCWSHTSLALRWSRYWEGGRDGGPGGQAGIMHTYVNWGGLQCGDLTRAQWMIAWRKGRVEYCTGFFKQRGDPSVTPTYRETVPVSHVLTARIYTFGKNSMFLNRCMYLFAATVVTLLLFMLQNHPIMI